MDARVIATFRGIGGGGRGFLERASSLMSRLGALGGVHVGWDVMKVTFAFEASRFPEVLDAAIVRGPETQGDEPPWAVGLAQGDIEPLAIEGSPLSSSGLLWWGPAIVAASALANLARPGEILCARTVPALRTGELVTSGLRIAREGTLRVRGARIDRRQPWKRAGAANLARMTVPRLFRGHVPKVEIAPGELVVVRAEPGAGGTRVLAEIASGVARSLTVRPAGSGFEPLGALRRALARSIGREINPLLLEFAGPLEALLAGKGISLETATRLISAFLWPKQSGTNSALLIDDGKAVDPATLEACVRAVRGSASIGMVVRLDGAGELPPALAGLSTSVEHEVPALTREAGEDIAVGCTGGALDAVARRRWARLGGGNPLAIVEAVTCAIANGDIAWSGERASPRSRSSGRGEIRPAAKWIRLRANAENTAARAVLSLLAVAGGEAKMSFLASVLDRAGLRFDVATIVAQLEQSRWIVAEELGGDRIVRFPSRTHHKALFTTLDDDARRKLHLPIAGLLDETEGVFGRVEAAWHAAQAGEGPRAASSLLVAARAAAEAHLGASTTQLIALARRADPSCEEAARALLAATGRAGGARGAGELEGAPSPSSEKRSGRERIAAIASVPPTPHRASAPPPPLPTIPPPTMVGELGEEEPGSMIERTVITGPKPTSRRVESAPPPSEDAFVSTAPSSRGAPHAPPPSNSSHPSNAPGSQIALDLFDAANEALLSAESVPAFTERVRAMAGLGRGEITDALRVLRRTRSQLDPSDHRRRCQTSLALGVALSAAGRPQEALLEGLDALARARQTGDTRGAKACLAFLAKLYTSVSRPGDAERLRASS